MPYRIAPPSAIRYSGVTMASTGRKQKATQPLPPVRIAIVTPLSTVRGRAKFVRFPFLPLYPIIGSAWVGALVLSCP